MEGEAMNDHSVLAVMYHYLRPRGEACPSGIRPMWVDEFEEQLDWLAERFEILDGARFGAMLKGEYRPRRPGCVLTFDDGTKDHATVATPILARRGLAGFFFLLTGPWLDRRLPAAHRVHVLLSRVAPEKLWKDLVEVARGHAVSQQVGSALRTGAGAAVRGADPTGAFLGEESEARRIYHYEDDVNRMRIKYAINFALPEALADRIAGELLARHVGDEGKLADEWFVTREEARRMAGAGMVLGTHGRNHLAIGRLSPEAAEAKIRQCHGTLSGVLPEPPRWYAYPFGGTGAQEATLRRADGVLKELGYAGVFIYDGGQSPWLNVDGKGFTRINRLDCIRLPPRGKLPLPF